MNINYCTIDTEVIKWTAILNNCSMITSLEYYKIENICDAAWLYFALFPELLYLFGEYSMIVYTVFFLCQFRFTQVEVGEIKFDARGYCMELCLHCIQGIFE